MLFIDGEEPKTKFLGIKIKGYDYFIWFKRTNTSLNNSTFTGKDGYGKGNNNTSITCNISEIVGAIHTDSEQYN